jgi:hypothetical protein
VPETDPSGPSPRRPSWAVRLLGAGGLLLALAAGAWLIGASVPGYAASIVITGGWFLVVGAVAEILARRRPGIGIALRGAFVAALLVSAFGFYWTSVRDEVVDEQVVAGVAASSLPRGEPTAAAATSAPRPAPRPAPRGERHREDRRLRVAGPSDRRYGIGGAAPER